MLNCDDNNQYLLQMKLFHLQANCLNDLISQDNNNIILNDDNKIPTILLNRVLPDTDLINQHRKIDNEEMTILGILDNKGEISNTTRLNEFMLLLSRIYKVVNNSILYDNLFHESLYS